jgi:hypothetical protein
MAEREIGFVELTSTTRIIFSVGSWKGQSRGSIRKFVATEKYAGRPNPAYLSMVRWWFNCSQCCGRFSPPSRRTIRTSMFPSARSATGRFASPSFRPTRSGRRPGWVMGLTSRGTRTSAGRRRHPRRGPSCPGRRARRCPWRRRTGRSARCRAGAGPTSRGLRSRPSASY